MTPAVTSHHARRMLGICVGLLLLMALPPSAARAAYVVPKIITNDVPSYTPGTFQRTQLSSFKSTAAQRIPDKSGAAQLMPMGILKFNRDALQARLPYRMIRMGVAVLGNRIFTIGGVVNGDGDNTRTPPLPPKTNESVDNVFSLPIATTASTDLVAGNTPDTQWTVEKSLPKAITSAEAVDDPTLQTSVVNSAAVVAVPTGANSGYIYVMGGDSNIDSSTRSFSSYAVRRGTVDASGKIATWDTLENARIPAADPTEGAFPVGLEKASAVTMMFNGANYIYLIGGVQRFLEGGTNIREIGSRAVFWAKVDGSGNLVKTDGTPGWNRVAKTLDIPSTNDNAGLWDASAIAGQYELAPGQSVSNVIYVLGGQIVSQNFSGTPSDEFSSQIKQIYVASDGTPTLGGWTTGTLPEARLGLGAVTYRGKHYLTGGVTPNAGLEPKSDMMTSYTKDDMTMPQFGGAGGANFLRDPTGIGAARAFHGMGLVPIGESAFVYLVGGQINSSGAGATYSDAVIFGKIGGQEEQQTYGFAPDGWYYSQPLAVSIVDAEIQEINWTTFITATSGMDVQISYRTTLDNVCDRQVLTGSDWQDVDGDPGTLRSANGDNTVSLTNVKARCFQYRAHLVGGGLSPQGLPSETPSLLNLSLKVVIPGSPDLRSDPVKDFTPKFNLNGQLTALNISIRNHNDKADLTPPAFEPTLAANIDESGGSFFVDLFIYKSDETIVAPTIPNPGGNAHNIACALVSKSEMGADVVRQISQWYVATATSNCDAQPVNLLNYFASRGAGTYVVYVVVDSYCGANPNGCVDETPAPNGEGNNIQRYEFTIALKNGVTGVIGYEQLLPLLVKSNAPPSR